MSTGGGGEERGIFKAAAAKADSQCFETKVGLKGLFIKQGISTRNALKGTRSNGGKGQSIISSSWEGPFWAVRALSSLKGRGEESRSRNGKKVERAPIPSGFDLGNSIGIVGERGNLIGVALGGSSSQKRPSRDR